MNGARSRAQGKIGERNFLNFLQAQEGWVAVDASEDDRGTDAFALLDPAGGTSYSALGFQVKTRGQVEFVTTREGHTGYWFRESKKDADKHFEYWADNYIPHFVIIQTPDERVRVWQRLDRQHMERTDKGGLRVFVPAANRVESDPPREWLAIAARQASQRHQQMTRWEIGQGHGLAEQAVARTAVLVPRLVAAHPNRARPAFSAEQALADTAMAGDMWDRRSKPGSAIPTPVEALEHPDERWRLAAAMHRLTSSEDVDSLAMLAQSTAKPWIRACARAVWGSSLITRAFPQEALEVLVPDVDFLPEDRFWLDTLRVSALRALGRVEELQQVVEDSLVEVLALSQDPGMRQLTAALVWARFKNSGHSNQSVGDVLTYSDHAALWWRDHHLASALRSSTLRTFEAWAATNRTRWGGEHAAHNEMVAASLQASLGGAVDDARGVTSIMSRLDIMRFEPVPSRLAGSLESLILSGDAEAISDALIRCTATTPAQYLRPAALVAVRALGDVDLSKGAVTGLHTLGPHLADDLKQTATEALLDAAVRTDGSADNRLRSSTFSESALRAIEDTGYPLRDNLRDRLLDWVLEADDRDELSKRGVSVAARILQSQATPVVESHRTRLLGRLRSLDQSRPRYWALVAALGTSSPAGVSRLGAGLAHDDDGAHNLIRRVDEYDLPTQRAKLDENLARLRAERIAPVTPGISFGGQDSAATAVQYAHALGDADALAEVAEYLADPKIKFAYKRTAAIWLADVFESVGGQDRDRLREAARVLADQRAKSLDMSAPFAEADIAGAPERLLLRLPDLSPAEADECIRTLIRGSVRQRRDLATALAYRPGHDFTLVALAHDASFRVRADAAGAMAFAAATRTDGREALISALTTALSTSGPATLKRVVIALESAESEPGCDAATADRVRDLVSEGLLI